jgi:hypothetical protein
MNPPSSSPIIWAVVALLVSACGGGPIPIKLEDSSATSYNLRLSKIGESVTGKHAQQEGWELAHTRNRGNTGMSVATNEHVELDESRIDGPTDIDLRGELRTLSLLYLVGNDPTQGFPGWKFGGGLAHLDAEVSIRNQLGKPHFESSDDALAGMAKLFFPVNDMATLQLRGDTAFNGSASATRVELGGQFSLTDWLQLEIGWQRTNYEHTNGSESDIDATYSGLFAGSTLKF